MPLATLENEISRCIVSETEISDDASPKDGAPLRSTMLTASVVSCCQSMMSLMALDGINADARSFAMGETA